MRTFQETPSKIVENGKFALGVFKSPFRNLNVLDADPLGLGGAAPRALRALRLKEWQHYALVTRDFYFGTVVWTAHYTANSFFFAFDRRSKKLSQHRKMLAPRQAVIAETLYDGKCSAKTPGYSVEYFNNIGAGRHEINVDIKESRGLPSIAGSFRVLEDLNGIQPLIVSLPLGGNRAMYSHKVVCPAEGELRVGGETVRIDPSTDVALVDVHKAYYPYHFWWKWANFAGFDDRGRIIGLNLTDNLIRDQKNWNECGMWIDGKLSLLGPARFEFDPSNTMKPWKIRDEEGRVALDFVPEGEKREELNLGFMSMHYRQPLGKFSGTLVDDAGAEHKIRGVFGVAEHMDARL
jgi:hypothetical protein